MLKRSLIVSMLCLLIAITGKTQKTDIIRAYIDTYRMLAIAEMQRSGVPASITLAQGIHETLAGTSDLVLQSNNHFGIKCRSDWKGESVSHDDDMKGECFRKYAQAADSYKDHSDFLKNGSRYAFLFNLDPLDYKDWAYGLKKAGYATNPKYPQVLIKLIEDYKLQDYSLMAIGKMQPPQDIAIAEAKPGNKEAAFLIAAAKLPEPVKIEEAPQYPNGEFRINNTKVVFAKKETSLLAMAQQYNVPLTRLFEFNDMQPTESLAKDQLIYLQRKRKTGRNEFHIVKQGETLRDIARDEAIRLESLLEYNHLRDDYTPVTGQQLYLRNNASTVSISGGKEKGVTQ